MKNKYDKALYRISVIQQRLYEGLTLNKKELAEEFNVSEKSIQRDINERLNSIPIVSRKGEGFRLNPDYIDRKKALLFSEQAKVLQSESLIELSIMEAREAIENADAILISAGAGMGVDSGLPDFRGDEGFWRAYPPMKKLGLNFADMANPKWFKSKPDLAWGFYGHRLNLYRDTTPHEGFKILKEIVSYKNDNYFIFTSNVDGQFQKADFDDDKIYECHGTIHYNQCIDNCKDDVWSNKDENIEVALETFTVEFEGMPKCKDCNSIARPNIMMFGDYAFNTKKTQEKSAKFNQWLQYNVVNKSNIVIIEIGAGEYVPTVRRVSEDISHQYNARHIRINPRDYNVENGQISIALGGMEALKKIFS